MSAELCPLVVDLSHHNTVTDWGKVYGAGIRGVIHKATQGTAYADPRFLQRYPLAKRAGLLWGAYHFATDGDTEAQVAQFLGTVERACGPDPWGEVLLALDWEPEPNGHTMSADQARRFLALVAGRTGQKPVLYGGQLLKDRNLVGPRGDSFLCEHRLWLSHYAAKPVLPPGFGSYFLWQYTGDGAGPGPHAIDGIEGAGIDLNVYPGTADDLAAFWVEPANPPRVFAAAASVAETLNKPEASAPIIKVPAETLNIAPVPVVAAIKESLTTAPAGEAAKADVAASAAAPMLRTAVQSKSLWALLIAGVFKAIEGLTQWLDDLWDLVLWAVGALPDITSDVRTTLTSSEEVARWFKIDWGAISVAVAAAVLLVVFVRHLADKWELEAHREANGEGAPAP
jgi:lysozyme